MKASDLDILIPKPAPEALLKPRWGVVTQASPLRVKLDGDDTHLPVTPASLVADLTVDDRVWTILNGRQLVVLGVWGGIPFPDPPVIPQPDQITRVARSSNYDTGGNVWATIPWETEVLDDAGAWASGTPATITTPAGFTRVQLTLYTAWTASTSAVGRFTRIDKGSTTLVVSNRRELFESAEQITTGWISTTAGDAFTASANSNGSGADLLGSGEWGGPCWFEAVFR